MASKKAKIEDVELCTGVMLSNAFFEKKENRLFTIFLKGFLVYLVSMGSIGFYLSAFKIQYNVFFCHVAIFIIAMICALLYYRLLVENLGYLLLLAGFALLVYTYKIIINSGFYAIVNITVEDASSFFGQTIRRIYTEQITDRYMTVTYVVLFIGIVLDILLNVYISRRMQYFTAIFIVMGLNMIPLYLTNEPDNFYVIMFLAGIAMTYIYKSGRHYGPQISTKRNDYIYEKKKKNEKELSYKYDVKAMCQAGIIAFAFIILSVNVITAFKPKETFNVGYKTNKFKELTMTGVSTFLIDGWSGFMRRSYDKGGLMGGRLGEVSSIKLDHRTDMVVQYTPYSYSTLYLKGFLGISYNSYDNYWSSNSEVADNYFTDAPETKALKNNYEESGAYAARGLMNIRYVDVGAQSPVPYYSGEITANGNRYSDTMVEYYPRLPDNQTRVDKSYYEDEKPYYDYDLEIPASNQSAIKRFVGELNVDASSTLDEKIYAIKTYYQENIPYTIRPGKTPKNEDFINYFLNENKKGYCSHFASAATLAFRYLGVPARYVEGYAVDYRQMVSGELVEDAVYEDYYDGYSELGKTALIEVNVTDADAHAWVEVYDEKLGWIVVDVTPSSDDAEENEDFWEAYENYINENPDSLLNGGGGGVAALMNIKISNSFIKKVAYTFLAVICIVVGLLLLWRLTAYLSVYIKFKNATINDKLIIKYSMKCKKLKRFDKDFKGKNNYREQIEYFGYGNDNIIDILERAGFSDKSISYDEYNIVITFLESLSGKEKQRGQLNATE